MKIRNTILAFSIAAAAVPAAFAAGSFGSQPANSQETRAQVQHELQEFSAHPVLYDGTVLLQGELGYVSANQVGVFNREPHDQQTHVLGSSSSVRESTAAAAPVSAEQRRFEREQYLY